MSQTMMMKEILQQPQLMKTLYGFGLPEYKRLADQVGARGIKSVVKAARGSSMHAGIFGQYLLSVYCGFNVAIAAPSVITKYGAKPDYSGSLVIGVSQSGEADDVIAVVRSAKSQGAVTAAITNEPSSPLAKCSDCVFTLNTEREVSVAATKTFMAQMFCMAKLAAVFGRDEKLVNELEKIGMRLEEELPALTEAAAVWADRCGFMREGFTAGRGYLYPVALEAALKIKETNYIKMQGISVPDIYHGPLAQIEPNIPAIIFAFKGPVLKDAAALAARLTELEADVMLVTDNNDLSAQYKNSVLIKNGGGEITGAFLSVLFAQLFAEALAKRRNKNPDAPRALKKVTITL